MKKIQTLAVTALLGLATVLSVSGCEAEDVTSALDEILGEETTTETVTETVIDETVAQSGDTGDLEWSANLAPDYYLVTGTANVNFDLDEGDFYYCNLDQLGRAGCAVSVMTTSTREDAKSTDRADIGSFSPTGWGYNEKVEIPSASPGVEGNYKGWFYNRSHMIADSLGGEAALENLVTGTRTQNVGNRNNQGGMAYTETIARDYLDSPEAIGCPLYYAVEAQYDGDDLVPKTTTVDMKTAETNTSTGEACEASIDMHVIVFNSANGYVVDYATGEFASAN